MADIGQQAADFGVNTGAGMAARAILNRSIPLPDFYNLNSPNHFGDSQAGQMLHGNGRAWRQFGLHQGGRLAGATLGNLIFPGLGGLIGGWAGGWLGDRIANQGHQGPVGTVTVGNINDTSGSGVPQIDPWTGNPISGLPSYMPDFTGGGNYSPYGPYAGGYQGLPQDDGSQGGGPAMPNFDYSDQYSGTRDEHGNPVWDPSADQNGDGRLNPSERRDASDWQLYGPSAFGSSVTNFMVGGSPVITGYRPAGGDMNQLATYNGRDWGG